MAALLAGVGVRILDLADFPGVTLPPEGETSYADNALGKARAVGRATGFLSLADDSGIEVDALGGRPGVLSARFGGEGLDDAGRNVEMLRVLDGVPPERRTARYRALIALSEPGGREAVTEGVVEGYSSRRPRGRRLRLRSTLLLPAARRHLRRGSGRGQARREPPCARDGPRAAHPRRVAAARRRQRRAQQGSVSV